MTIDILMVLAPIVGMVIVFGALIAIGSSLKYASSFKDGLYPYVIYVLLISSALSIFLVDRDFTSEFGQYVGDRSGIQSTIGGWIRRLASFFIMVAALERFLYFFRQPYIPAQRFNFLLVILVVWIAVFAIPYFYTAGHGFSVSYFYAFALAVAIILSLQKDREAILLNARNAFVVFVGMSLVAIFIKPNLVLDFSYGQGLVAGLPRFFGLSPHAGVMGITTVIAIWLVMTYPFSNKITQKWVLITLAFALILTQSKTAIVIVFVGIYFHYIYFVNDKGSSVTSFILPILALFGSSLMIVFLVFIDWSELISNLLGEDKLESLMTFTGRDAIWEVALSEFRNNPIFGYGGNLFSSTYSAMIQMKAATHGHNQFIDALGRSGIIGFLGYVLLYIYLGFYSIKYAKATKGLTLSLFSLIALSSITQVPIVWSGISVVNIPLFILLMVIVNNFNDVKVKNITENSDNRNYS